MGANSRGSMGFGQFAATSQFFLHGKKHFTANGYARHRKEYPSPDPLDLPDLAQGEVFIVTGANSGIGFEIAQWLASKDGVVYMVCRSAERAQAARDRIVQSTGNESVYVLQCDCSLEKDVRDCWREFETHSEATRGEVRLDCLGCNAGVLLNERTLTSEGVEVTFATHLLFGTYLLGELAKDTLRRTPHSRMLAVSSGGMLNTPFPDWDVACSMKGEYDGNLAYAYVKRAQVLLMERWAESEDGVTYASCHPGWTETPGVQGAFGDDAKYLAPMRTPWQGSEGICWLCVTPSSTIEAGAFYLDRAPREKHMAGPFFSEGSFTKNSRAEVDHMMMKLAEWADGSKRPVMRTAEQARQADTSIPLRAMESRIEIEQFMGTWYVQTGIFTFLENGNRNPTEHYELKGDTIHVTYTYTDSNGKPGQLLQKAKIENTITNTHWSISPKVGPFYVPLGMGYLVLHCAEDYSSCVIGTENRKYLWIMSRELVMEPEALAECVECAELCGYEVDKLQEVEHDGIPSTMPRPRNVARQS